MNSDSYDFVEIIECTSAEEFVNTLRKSSSIFSGGSFVFRGHSEVSFQLLPSIYRADARTSAAYEYIHNINRWFMEPRFRDPTPEEIFHRDVKILTTVEHELLTRFALASNEIGLAIPELEKAMVENEYINLQSCIPGLIDGLFERRELEKRRPPLYAGLAQHHGVKTRLLDFSYNPQKAVYFATRSNGDIRENGESICVWAIPQGLFEDNWFYSVLQYRIKDNRQLLLSKYSKMVMATSVNDFLYRQEGLFLYPVAPHEFNLEYGKYPTVLDFVNNIIPFAHESNKVTKVYKVTAPANLSNQINRILKDEGISRASLMPTFDHVVREMDEYPGL